jgi:exodeoxyribonuclease VII small subunit
MAAKLSFEKAMEQLEQIVQELESEELPLEKAIKKFEEGIKLSKFCNQKLEESEKKVTVLMEGQDGQPKEADREDSDG